MNKLGRASAIIGAGTLVSRITGLLRTIVLVGVIGSVGRVPDAFTVANQLPNNVFQLISVGVLTAVIVPQIVKSTAHADGGDAFISKLFTLGTVVLIVAAGIATVAAPWLVRITVNNFTDAQMALATAFAYWCLPQILFYGLYSLLGEALNARGIYGPFTWAPVINNLVSIAGFLLLGYTFVGDRSDVTQWGPDSIAALGGTATLGIVIQALVLLVFWRRTGLSLRPDFRWRGVGLGNVGRLAGWTMVMAVVSLAAGLVQSNIVSAASGDGASTTVMANAWLIFMLPYSVIVLSIGTPYFTRLSAHAAEGADEEVRADIARSIRFLGFFICAAIAAVAAAAIPASRIFVTGTGATAEALQASATANAEAAALVLLCYLVSLLPLTVLFIVQRTFYAYDDTRTPFWFTMLQCTLTVITALTAQGLLSAGVLPLSMLAAAIALGQSIASTTQAIIATILLHRRLGGIKTATWTTALGRFVIAAVPAGFAGWGVFLLLGGSGSWMLTSQLLGAVGTAIIGAATVVVYLIVLVLLRATELHVLRGLFAKLLRR